MSEPTFTQRMEVAGQDLVERVKTLAGDANARRVIIRNKEGKELLAVPLGWGVAGGALAVVAAPVLAAVAAIGAAVSDLRLEVERTGEPGPQDDLATTQDDTVGPQDGASGQGGRGWSDEQPPPLPHQH